MIEGLRNDEIIDSAGGRFKLTALIQKRWLEIMHGARPMVDPEGLTDIEVVIQEIAQGKIAIDYEKSDISPPGGQ